MIDRWHMTIPSGGAFGGMSAASTAQGGSEQFLHNSLPNTRQQQVLTRATGTKNP
jgi:hypothetical protein